MGGYPAAATWRRRHPDDDFTDSLSGFLQAAIFRPEITAEAP